MDAILSVFENWGVFVGAAALIALLINLLKLVGVVKDGDAPKWNAGLNLAFIIGLAVVQAVVPDLSLKIIDEKMGTIAAIGTYVFGYILDIGISKLTHVAVKGVPYIGTSHTEELIKAVSEQPSGFSSEDRI